MPILSALFLALAGAQFTAGLAFSLGPATRERRITHLLLALLALLGSAFLVCKAVYYQGGRGAEMLAVQNAQVAILLAFLVALPPFIATWCGQRQWPAWLAALPALAALGLHPFLPAGIVFADPASLTVTSLVLPWGEAIHRLAGPVSPWYPLELAAAGSAFLHALITALMLITGRDPGRHGQGWVLAMIVLVWVVLAGNDIATDLGLWANLALVEFVPPFLVPFVALQSASIHQRAITAHERIFAAIADGVFVHDAATGRILEVNQRACELVGRSRAELLASPVSALVDDPALDQQRVRRILDLAVTVGEQRLETTGRRADGSTFPAEVTARAIDLGSGPRALVTVRDLTALRRAEAAHEADERRLRLFVARSPVPIITGRLDGAIEFFNDAFVALTGYDRMAIPDLPTWFRLAHRDEAAAQGKRFAALVAAAGPGGHLPTTDLQIFTADGELRDLEVNGVISDRHWFLYVQDRTERKAAAARLAAQEAFHRAIIEQAADGFCVCHPVGEEPFIRFTVWNQRMCEITGYDLATINRQGWHQTVYPDPEVRARARERMDRMQAGDDLVGEHWTITRADGQERTLAISTSCWVDEAGTSHVLALMRDVTEEARWQARAQAAQKLESLGVLAGGVAHDFNNLLMTIQGRADLAERHLDTPAKARSHLAEIGRAVRRSADLCHQLLAYAGKGRFVLRPVDLRQLVLEMGQMLDLGSGHGVELAYDLGHDAVVVEADQTQLRQVAMNLITNASEAIGDQRGTVTLRTRRGREDGREVAILEVADNGCGMDHETRERLFEPFFTTKFTGRGLGMAAVQGIVRSHRGTIAVDSEAGLGTTVRICLPRVDTDPDPGSGTWTATRKITRLEGTLLVVDDEEAVRELAVELLEDLGLTTVTAADGLEALQAYRRHADSIDGVLLDLTMPRMDGAATLRELRILDPDLPVILSSGYSQEAIDDRFGQDEVQAFIQKPYTAQALAAVLATALERRPG